jgi:hypothetical protein
VNIHTCNMCLYAFRCSQVFSECEWRNLEGCVLKCAVIGSRPDLIRVDNIRKEQDLFIFI